MCPNTINHIFIYNKVAGLNKSVFAIFQLRAQVIDAKSYNFNQKPVSLIDCPPCRHLYRCDDCRLGPSALRLHGEGVERDHQQGPWCQPRLLRHLLQAPRNDRVGIKIGHF